MEIQERRKELWARIDIIGKLLLGVGTIAVAFVTSRVVRDYTVRNVDLQVGTQLRQMESQHQVNEAQLAVSLMPALLEGPGKKREAAMVILSSVAPTLAKSVSESLEKHATTPDEKRLVAEVARRSNQNQAEQDFLRHVENARTYRSVNLAPQAIREYLLASDEKTAPERYRPQIEKARETIAAARRAYTQGEFSQSLQLLETAFESIGR